MANFITFLTQLLGSDPLRETILLCPSQRVGRQWLDQAAARTGGVVNVRTATIKRLIRDYAEAPLRARGLRPASPEEKIRLIGVALERMAAKNPGAGYFSRLPASLQFSESLLASLEELEAARIRDGDKLAEGIRIREKADELAALLDAYRAARQRAGLAGDAEVAAAAASALPGSADAPLLVVPAHLARESGHLERRFLSRWPREAWREALDDGGPCRAELSFHSADCVANEARQALRLVQAASLPLDQVEIICLDDNAYAPALCAAAVEAFDCRVEDAPLTFNGGVPGWYSRPARLLAAWLDWLESGLPPMRLADIVESRLLAEDWRGDGEGPDCAAFAERLRALPINGAPADYLRELGAGAPDGRFTATEAWLADALAGVMPVGDNGRDLDLFDAPRVLRAAGRLLRLGEAEDGKLDAYARVALAETVAAWTPYADWSGFSAVPWLRRLLDGLRVMGLGPMPGRLHVADLPHGGHSGRRHTFILGLDDTRYPGSIRQDPVLLDRERRELSRNLPQSAARRERREAALARLMARLEGRAYLSYASRDSERNRELFPAAVYARLREERRAPVADATLRPKNPAACLSRRDDWVRAILEKRANTLTTDDLAPWFPNLSQGGRAAAARESDRFTEWDGNVPEAGLDYQKEGWSLSPTELETLAACPMEFFFKKVLRARPPERYELLPGRWLAGNERGNLLHDLFQDFLTEMLENGEWVDADSYARHRDLLADGLESALRRQQRRKPPRDALAYDRERAEMYEACVIFLTEEARRQARGRPVCLEAAFGGAEADAEWDRVCPVEVPLGSGDVLHMRGRVDRVDRLNDHGGLMIWDYKTGSSRKFSRSDPFDDGRHLQPLLYTRMLEAVLAEKGNPDLVLGFSYFFPMPRDEGRTYTYERSILREGGDAILDVLAGMLRTGCFPFTTDQGDVVYSDYGAVYGDVAALAAAARRKAAADPALAAWANLRGLAD